MTLLGAGFTPRLPDPEPVVVDPQVLLIEALQASNNQLRESLLSALGALPVPAAPIVEVDLARVVQAVTDLGGTMHSPSADELAAAIARVIAPAPVDASQHDAVLAEMAAALEKLDFRMKGGLSHLGSGGGIMHFDPAQLNPDGTLKVNVTNDVTDRVGRLLGHVSVDSAPAVTGTVDVGNFPATQAVSESGQWHTAADPPSAAAGRVHKQAAAFAATTDQTLYTVTTGKTLYVTSLTLVMENTSLTSIGDLRVEDGSTGLTGLLTPAGVSATANTPTASMHHIFPEPKQFTTSFVVHIVAGTVTYSASFTGYEA